MIKKISVLIAALSLTFTLNISSSLATDIGADKENKVIDTYDINESTSEEEKTEIEGSLEEKEDSYLFENNNINVENILSTNLVNKHEENRSNSSDSNSEINNLESNAISKSKEVEPNESDTKKEDFTNEDIVFYEIIDIDKLLIKNQEITTIRDDSVYKEYKGNSKIITNDWVKLDDKTYYTDKNGKLLKGLHEIEGERYFFNKNTGEIEKDIFENIDDEKYYIDTDGVARRIGWDYFNGNFSYVKENGLLSKGLTEVSQRHYFFDNLGNMMTDTNQKVANQWWYFDFWGEGKKTNGQFKTGWHGDYYYFADGKRAQGYQKVDGKLYYFDDRYYNKVRNFYGAYDFKAYYFDSNGVGRFQNDITKQRTSSGASGFKEGQSYNYGRKTPYYNQRDGRWAYREFARTNDNFASAGCGSTAMAMALSRVKGDPHIYPTTVANDAWYYTNEDGTEWEFVKDEAIRYGLKAYRIPINEKALIQALKEGPVVVRINPGYFINAGHFMVIDSYKDGKFIINDPYYYENTNERHPFSRIRDNVTTAWLIKE